MSERMIEVACVPVKPDVDLVTGRSDARAAWDSAMNMLSKQAGLLALYWGPQIESPDTMQMIVEWDAVSSQEAFTAGPEYLPFVTSLKDIMCGPPSLYNVSLPTSFAADGDAFVQPVTEIRKTYFPPSPASSTVSSNERFSQFQAAVEKTPHLAAIGVIGGWSLAPKDESSSGDVEARSFTLFIGWPNVEAQEVSVEGEEFRKALADLNTGVSRTESVRVALRRVK